MPRRPIESATSVLKSSSSSFVDRHIIWMPIAATISGVAKWTDSGKLGQTLNRARGSYVVARHVVLA